MTSEPPQADPPILPYADLPARWGVVCERGGGRLLIRIPPVPWWMDRDIVLCLIAALACAAGAWSLYRVTGNVEAIASLGFPALVCLVVAVLAILWRRTVIIEIDDHHVTLRNVRVHQAASRNMFPRTVRFQRDQVYDVRHVGHSRMIVLRVRGDEMFEFRPVPDDTLLPWLADQITGELMTIKAADAVAPSVHSDSPDSRPS